MLFLMLLTLPLLFVGIINKLKARFVGKRGASIYQPYYDVTKLLKKGEVISNTTSLIFKLAPSVNLACVIIAGLLLTLFHFNGDFILFSYILALGKFFTVVAAMDTGSSFEGMGASREVCFTTIVEPAFFMIMASIMAISGNYTFDALTMILEKAGTYGVLIIIFAVVALFMMVLIECSRVPVDDPTTHLELTMIHEVMILDNSGKDFAFLTWSNSIKMLLISSLIANLLIPQGLEMWQSFSAYLAVLFIIALLIGTVESGMARIRMTHVFEFVFVMSSIALIILSLVVAGMFGG